MRSSRVWSTLILTSWICVLLASANASMLPPKSLKPESPEPSTEAHRTDYHEAGSAQYVLAFQPFQSSPTNQRRGDTAQHEVADAEKRIADAEQQIAFFTRILAGAAILQFLVTLAYAAYARGQLREIRRQADQAHDIANLTRDQVNAARDNASASESAARAAEESVTLAHRTLVITQRPKLIARNIVVEQPTMSDLNIAQQITPGLYFIWRLVISNVGGTPATIIDAGSWIYAVSGELPMEKPYDQHGGGNTTVVPGKLSPGQQGVLKIGRTIEDIVGGHDIFSKVPRQVHIQVMGWVAYTDDIGITRRTSFCRRWDWGEQRFLPVNNPDYEHAE